MGLNCRFIMPNEDFSQKIADEKHDGMETDDNYSVLWEDEILISSSVKDIQEEKNSVYKIQGTKDGKPFEFTIPNMRVWNIVGAKTNQIAVSESVLDEVGIDLEDGLFEVLFKEKSVLTNVIPGVYFDVDDFPKELQE